MPVNAPVVAASGSWTRKLVDLSTVWRSSMRLGFRKVETAAFQGIDERARWNKDMVPNFFARPVALLNP
jgi:hypothetical protein